MVRFTFLALLLLVSVWSPSEGSPTAHSGYRLAGVMAAGDGYLGFLELPQGDQVLVRLGSVVDGGTVVAFDSKALRIRFPDGVVELSLEGSGKPPPPDARQVVVTAEEQGRVMVRGVDVAGLDAALDAQREAKTSASAKGAPNGASLAVTQRFAPLVGLPADARIVEVNEQKIGSPAAAVELVQQTLSAGMPARLNLQTPEGFRRVYLVPAKRR
jgi:hypothetical protein